MSSLIDFPKGRANRIPITDSFDHVVRTGACGGPVTPARRTWLRTTSKIGKAAQYLEM
jgi:hypothetical protein